MRRARPATSIQISETYLGDPVEIPVTVINGEQGGPSVFMTAALHGDELNGVRSIERSPTSGTPRTGGDADRLPVRTSRPFWPKSGTSRSTTAT